MKTNVTIVLDRETARWLRVEAARCETSVSRYVGELVQREREREEQYGAAMARFLSREARRLGPAGQALPTREDIHER